MVKHAILILSLFCGTASSAVAEEQARWLIKPSQAAIIAQGSVPGATVLNVKALPSEQYVVTLRQGNAVLRVTVNAMSGAVN